MLPPTALSVIAPDCEIPVFPPDVKFLALTVIFPPPALTVIAPKVTTVPTFVDAVPLTLIALPLNKPLELMAEPDVVEPVSEIAPTALIVVDAKIPLLEFDTPLIVTEPAELIGFANTTPA